MDARDYRIAQLERRITRLEDSLEDLARKQGYFPSIGLDTEHQTWVKGDD